MYIIKKINHKIKSFFFRFLSFDMNSDSDNTILLAGTGRSGTTWVSNLINFKNDYRYMFEPFHNQKVKIMQKNFEYRQYLNPNKLSENHYQLIKKVVQGKVRNLWIDSHNRKLLSKHRLIKDIRANFILYYIYKYFPEIPIIFVIRHPCAVAYSKIKLGWKIDLDNLLQQEQLNRDYLNPYRSFIKDVNKNGTDFEKHIVLWCIENYIPLKQFEDIDDILFLFYENLCLYPEQEIPRLFKYLGKQADDRVYSILNIPSQVTRKDSSINVGENIIKSWGVKITLDQMERSKEILREFGLDTLYNTNSIGEYNELQRVIKSN